MISSEQYLMYNLILIIENFLKIEEKNYTLILFSFIRIEEMLS